MIIEDSLHRLQPLIIRASESILNRNILKSLKLIFLEFPGDNGVELQIVKNDGGEKILEITSILVDADDVELVALVWELLYPADKLLEDEAPF